MHGRIYYYAIMISKISGINGRKNSSPCREVSLIYFLLRSINQHPYNRPLLSPIWSHLAPSGPIYIHRPDQELLIIAIEKPLA